MAIIKEFKDYLNEIQNEIEGINMNRMITHESQLTKYINDLSFEDNCLMLGLVPNFGNNSARNADTFALKGFTEIMILEKTDYSEITDEEFVEQFDRLFAIAQKVKQKLLNDHIDASCNIVRKLDPSSIQIVDVYNSSQCNGWTIIFTFDLM